MDNAKYISISEAMIDLLRKHGWEHKEEMVILYNEEHDVLEIVPTRKAKLKIKTPRGRLELPIERLTPLLNRTRCVLRIT